MIACLVCGLAIWIFALIGVFSVAESIASNGEASTPEPRMLLLAPETNPSAADIVGLPRYPGSARIEYVRDRQGEEIITEVEYLTVDDAGAVRAHFRSAFGDRPWTVIDTTVEGEDWTYTVSHGQQFASVEIDRREGLTEIEIDFVAPVVERDPASAR